MKKSTKLEIPAESLQLAGMKRVKTEGWSGYINESWVDMPRAPGGGFDVEGALERWFDDQDEAVERYERALSKEARRFGFKIINTAYDPPETASYAGLHGEGKGKLSLQVDDPDTLVQNWAKVAHWLKGTDKLLDRLGVEAYIDDIKRPSKDQIDLILIFEIPQYDFYGRRR